MRWVYGSTRDPPVRHADVAAVHAALDRGQHHHVDENVEGQWKGCRKQGGRLGKGARKEVCSLTDASRNVQKGGSAACKCNMQMKMQMNVNVNANVNANVCQRALTKR